MPRFLTRFPRRFPRQKRPQWSSVSSRSGTDDDYDVESHEKDHDGESESSSSVSSPTTVGSYSPMLAKSRPSKFAVRAYRYNTLDRRKCNQYFALALGSALIIFILTLFRMSYHTRTELETLRTAPPPPPKPPLYEQFPFLDRYYGGIRSLVAKAENVPEYPGDHEDMLEMLEKIRNESSTAHEEEPRLVRREEIQNTTPRSKPFDPFHDTAAANQVVECFLDDAGSVRVPKVHAFDGVVKGFPDNIYGSHELLALDDDVCFDRFGRFGPYGYGYSAQYGGTGSGFEGDTEGSQQVWQKTPKVNYRNVKWADAQARCIQANAHRFKKDSKHEKRAWWDSIVESKKGIPSLGKLGHDKDSIKPSQAVVIRTWSDYQYDAEDIMSLRALIAELSLASGGEFVVHFLVHVKNVDLPIWSDEEVHQRVLNESLPEEFRGMGTLWSEKQMALIYAGLAETNYRGLGVYGVYRSTFMPMQYFAHQHPEYDFFWHWELDIRYTGHFYNFFSRTGEWAKQQPRKGLWERNGRFYFPSEHGSWEDFRQMVRVQTEHGTNSKGNMWTKYASNAAGDAVPPPKAHLAKPIWGPLPPEASDLDHENDPQPPTTYEKDNYEWGVGEDADLITFNPLFDPDQTGWLLAEDVTGYNTENGFPPRRTAIITAGRLSRRLLSTMHRETALKKHTMFSEMWPGSCALHHGLKAVYVPHPVWVDRKWPTDYFAATLNGGLNGASGGARTSPFQDFNQRNFLGVTWYYHAGFAPNLFKRWMGINVDNTGGPDWETDGRLDENGSKMEGSGEGRMCLPSMLIHPVKQVDLPYEKTQEELDIERAEAAAKLEAELSQMKQQQEDGNPAVA